MAATLVPHTLAPYVVVVPSRLAPARRRQAGGNDHDVGRQRVGDEGGGHGGLLPAWGRTAVGRQGNGLGGAPHEPVLLERLFVVCTNARALS